MLSKLNLSVVFSAFGGTKTTKKATHERKGVATTMPRVSVQRKKKKKKKKVWVMGLMLFMMTMSGIKYMKRREEIEGGREGERVFNVDGCWVGTKK